MELRKSQFPYKPSFPPPNGSMIGKGGVMKIYHLPLIKLIFTIKIVNTQKVLVNEDDKLT